MQSKDSHYTSNIDQCRLIALARHHHDNGNLSVVENNNELPFEIERVYYLYDIPGGEERGGHSHRECYEFITAVSGSFDIEIDDGKAKKTITLNRSNIGLLVIPGIWRVLNNFSSGSVCLVIASQRYNEADYVREYKEFKELTAGKQ
ncbi:MAG: FdtA/QdtA family cupin domain-containing protein [Muribaculaceae bacterium]|nr:FdtA/QdtA family cupin domain-containing protein [Muribaculaceae bacterium]